MKSFIALQMDDSTSIGYALKTTVDWAENGNGSDLFGFSALPATKAHYRVDFASSSYVSSYGFYFRWALEHDDWLISEFICYVDFRIRFSIRRLKD